MQESPWLYPAVEVVHLLGLGLVVGPALMWDLRLLGLSKSLPVSAMARHLLPWTLVGFGFVAVSGPLLFLADAVKLFENPALRIKLVLIFVAAANAALFHRRAFRTVGAWETNAPAPPAAKAAAGISVVVWVSVVIAGRLIAYV